MTTMNSNGKRTEAPTSPEPGCQPNKRQLVTFSDDLLPPPPKALTLRLSTDKIDIEIICSEPKTGLQGFKTARSLFHEQSMAEEDAVDVNERPVEGEKNIKQDTTQKKHDGKTKDSPTEVARTASQMVSDAEIAVQRFQEEVEKLEKTISALKEKANKVEQTSNKFRKETQKAIAFAEELRKEVRAFEREGIDCDARRNKLFDELR